MQISSNGHQPVSAGVTWLRMSIDESANSVVTVVTAVVSPTVSEIRQLEVRELQIFPTPLSFEALALDFPYDYMDAT